VQLAIECGDVVCRDCAWILENLKQVSDAAMLHEKGGNLERASPCNPVPLLTNSGGRAGTGRKLRLESHPT